MSAIVLTGADVRTMRASSPRASALAWRGSTLVAVGDEGEVLGAAGDDAIVVPLGGATVVPGFHDAHQHPCIHALYGGVTRLGLPDVKSIADLQRVLADTARRLPDGSWVVARDWNEAHLAEGRPPTRAELDDAAPKHPVLALHYSCHRAVASSRALELAGIDAQTPEPSGGAIARGAGGKPSGLLVERGMSRVESLARASMIARDPEGFFARLVEHHRALAAAGITRVVDATVPADLVALYREAARRQLLVVPTVMLPVSSCGWLEAPTEALDGPRTGTREGLLRFGPVKMVFDGAPTCAMCLGWWQTAGVTLGAFALSIRLGSLEPLRNSFSVQPRLGRKIRTGISLYRPDKAHQMVSAALDRGFAVATHAIGNEAIDVVLDVYAKEGDRLAKHGTPRIEHATYLDRRRIADLRALGVAAVMQPNFLELPAFSHAPSVPGLANTALRWLLDAGVPVAGSSDYPVAGFAPLDGIRAAVTRRTGIGRVLEREQAITLDEALRMYTATAAEVTGTSDECGTIEPGKRADLAIMEGPLTEATLAEAKVRATVIGGKIEFGALTPR